MTATLAPALVPFFRKTEDHPLAGRVLVMFGALPREYCPVTRAMHVSESIDIETEAEYAALFTLDEQGREEHARLLLGERAVCMHCGALGNERSPGATISPARR